ncbi:MAG: DUF1631 family protein, partial [Polaromonas sp.]
MAPTSKKNSLLAEQARALFTERAVRVLRELANTIQDRLTAMVDQPGSAREMQERRDTWLAFQKSSAAWVQGTTRAWTQAQAVPLATAPARFTDSAKFELMGNDVMEDKILASRLALRLLDFASWELNDLRLRVQNLEAIPELHKQDILRPEVLAQHLVEQWTHAPLPRDAWLAVQDLIQRSLAEHLLEIYHATNEFLVQQGVMAEIDLRPLVRRTPSAAGVNTTSKLAAEPAREKAQSGHGAGGGSGETVGASRVGGYPAGSAGGSTGGFGTGKAGAHGGSDPASGSGRAVDSGGAGGSGTAAGPESSGSGRPVYDETRMQTATTPLARARMRAQGVMGHLRRLLTDHVAGFDDTRPNNASAQLAQAMASVQRAEESGAQRTLLADAQGQVYGQAHVDQAMGALRQRTSAL